MIDIKNVSLIYDDQTVALHDLTMQFKGRKCALIGENGSGKSSLLKSMAGLNEFTGQIEIDGIMVDQDHLNELRHHVGFLFQNPDHQLFMSRVYDDIAFGLVNLGFDEQTIKEKVEAIAQELHIEGLLNRSPMKLSGGQKSLCALAGVLVMDPQLLLLDEPTAYLDPRSRRHIMHILQNIEVTQIIASHDLDFVYDLCDEVALIEEGHLIKIGDRSLLEDQQLLESHHLELPLRFEERK